MVLEKCARVLSDRVQVPAQRRECLAVQGMSVRCCDDVGTSLVYGSVDDEGGPVHRCVAHDHVALVVDEDQIRDSHVAEAHPERVDPEPVRELRVARSHVAGDAFAEAQASKKAQGGGQLRLSLDPLGLD